MQNTNTIQPNMTTNMTTNTNLSIGQLIDPNFDPVGAAKQTNWVAVAGLHQNWAVFGTQNCEEAAQFVAQLRQEHEYESDCADLDEEMLLEELDND